MLLSSAPRSVEIDIRTTCCKTNNMNTSKRKKLEQAGWKIGTAAELLSLSPQEVLLVDEKLALAQKIDQQHNNQNRWRFFGWLLVSLLVIAGVDRGFCEEKKADSDEQPALVAQAEKTYELLLKDYRTGNTTGALQLELLNRWSQRIVLANLQASLGSGQNKAEFLTKRHVAHARRMRELKAIVAELAAKGIATKAEVAAAEFFQLEGDDLLTRTKQQGREHDDRELDIKLPAASEAVPLVAPRELLVTISADGKYTVRGEQLDKKELQEVLRKEAADRPGSHILIRAHSDAAVRHFIEVLNLCKKYRLQYELQKYRLRTD